MSVKGVSLGLSGGTRRYLRMKPAAEYANVSVSTIRRNKELLVSKGTKIDQNGWLIPEEALDEVFKLKPTAGFNETPSDTPLEAVYDALVAQLKTENEFLREQVISQTQTIAEQAKAHAVIAGQLAKLELETTTDKTTSTASQQTDREPKKRWWKL